MTAWWMIMLGGLLGSSHCIGMCAPFAAMVGLSTGSFWGNVRAQFIYSFGRIISYVTLGAIAGFAGQRLSTSIPALVNVPAALCILSGLFLIREGLLAAGVWPRKTLRNSSAGCLMAPLFSTILRTPGGRNAFVAGIVTGLLPCGLVYAFVSLAASSTDLLGGMAVMALFGSGTVPLMVTTGCGASLLDASARKQLWQMAAWSIVLTGTLTLYRGATFVQFPGQQKSLRCPFCTSETDPKSASTYANR